MKDRERIGQIRIQELSRFNEGKGIVPGEPLDVVLAQTDHPILLFTTPSAFPATLEYQRVIGKDRGNFQIITTDDPIRDASQVPSSDAIPLVMHSATDPVLFKRMFADGPDFGQLLMGHLYIPTPGHQSPSLYALGVANQGIEIIGNAKTQSDRQLEEQMAMRRREALGSVLSNDDFRKILQSGSVGKIIAHALGPVGTNISQAMEQYVRSLGVEGKTELVVHPGGIEPLANEKNPVGYVDIARDQVEPGVIPIHMECAVYYRMGDVFKQKPNEVVFADHHYMPLDAMQLGSVREIEDLAASGIMKVTTHPSPRPLIDPWVKSGQAEWIKATSNSEAAKMVVARQADACITTGSGLEEAKGLVSRHIFGSPTMIFTIATPLAQRDLQRYR